MHILSINYTHPQSVQKGFSTMLIVYLDMHIKHIVNSQATSNEVAALASEEIKERNA